jgi:hypothetical protein
MSASDEIHLQIEPGGSLDIGCPHTDAERSTYFSMAFGLSLLLGGAVVKVAHWLPALHLYVQAAPDMVRVQTVPVASVWPDLAMAMQQWMACQSDDGVFHFEGPWGACSLAAAVYQWPKGSVDFTLNCLWPAAVIPA